MIRIIIAPLPKTAMMDRLRAEVRLPDEDYWDRCTYYDAIFEPDGLTAAQLERGVADLHRRLFSREAIRERRAYVKEVRMRLREQAPELKAVLQAAV